MRLQWPVESFGDSCSVLRIVGSYFLMKEGLF